MMRPRRPALTLEEARRIVDQKAAAGHLDTGDPSIARTVGEAQQVLTRAAVWGDDAATRRRTRAVALLMLGGIALFLTGLTLAVALTVHP